MIAYALRFTHEKGQTVDRPMWLAFLSSNSRWASDRKAWSVTETFTQAKTWKTCEAAERNAELYTSENYTFVVEEVQS